MLPVTADAKGRMSTRKIPKSGESIPAIGMGTWSTFDVRPTATKLAPLAEVLEAFFAAGGRVIDSSPMYGRSEEVVGKLLGQVKGGSDAWLATKVWTRGKQAGIDEMNGSIRKMGGRMDLMQVHNLLDYRTHIETVRAWKKEGRFRYIGITHYRLGEFDELERLMKADDLDFIQLPYSIGVREAEKRLLPCARDTGTAVLVMRPFEAGSLFRRTKGKALPAWAAEFDCTSWAQFFLKFLLGHPDVTCPIPATSKVHHMRDNMQAGVGRMPDAAMRKRMIAHLGL